MLYTHGVTSSSLVPPTKIKKQPQKDAPKPPNTSGHEVSDPITARSPAPDIFQDVRNVPQRYIQLPRELISCPVEEQYTMNLQEALDVYEICARSENKSEHTITWVKQASKRLQNFVGKEIEDICSLNTGLLRRFVLSLDKEPAFANHPFNHPLKRPVSPETKSNYVRGLKSLFSRLLSEGYIKENPMARIKTPKVPTREPVILDLSELSSLFGVINKTVAKGFRDFCIFLTLLDTGMRVSELCQLTLDDVDLRNGYFRLMGKGKKERFVPMGFKLTKALLKYLSSYRYKDTGSSYFFITEEGHPLNRNRVGKILRDYVRKAGITGKRVHPHVFRATKAVFFLRNGGDVFSLQKCLGHATLTMTRRYSAIADSDVKASHLKYGVVDKLNL
jgi:integrase/recombinase XerD